MEDDLLQWAQGSPGVGESGLDLLRLVQPAPPPIDPRTKPVRRRPNRGRTKRTDRTPGLAHPPWDLLEATGFPVPRDIECLPYTPLNWRQGGYYLQWRKEVHARWGYTCHLCGHEDAHTADHLIPLSVWSNQPYDARLARPAHGVVQPDGSEGCPTCYVKCNSSRGNRQLARQIANYQPPIAL